MRQHHEKAGAGVLVLALGMWVGTPGDARAQEGATGGHRLSAYFTTHAALYQSDTQTMGGLGGGVGLRDTVDERFILQADLSYLTGIGNTAALRVGAGMQWRHGSAYAPAALLSLTTLMGDRLSFLTPEHPTPVVGPGLALGLTLEPVRFDFHQTHLSLLQLGVGVGTDGPVLGLCYTLGLLEVGATF